jgi:hypothetical protein
MLEDVIASLGCTVSGRYLKEAFDNKDLRQLLRYLLNQDTPQRSTVGIGNVWLETAANLWKGQACSSLGDCTPVSVSKMQTRNAFGQIVDISNPFGPQLSCAYGHCATYQPDETESYVRMTSQLLNWEMNIEYVATNLEVGALRTNTKGFKPTAFNSATWHLRGLQTDQEIEEGRWNPGGAVWILDHIPTALKVMDLTSTWDLSTEQQYARYR